MTDKEIIQALECCGDEEELNWCVDCPCYDKENDFCQEGLHRDALDLINRQQAEIEKKTEKIEELSEILSDHIRIRYQELRAEAIKEFAEKLKDISFYTLNDLKVVEVKDIDNLIKEMVGADNE